MPQPKPTVVILGDWYIDENWLVSQADSYHSSATGDVHYLALPKDVKAPIINLCAAAGLLLTLKSYLSRTLKDRPLFFRAFGVWNPEDNDLFSRILCPISGVTLRSPYTLKRSAEASKDCSNCFEGNNSCDYEQMLVNLAASEDSASVSTNRVIRCYEGHSGMMPHQLYRFDWVLPCLPDNINPKQIYDSLEKCDVQAIIIVDHGAGAVNESTIQQLIESITDTETRKIKEVPWFVYTKIDKPDWMKVLEKKGIELEMAIMDFHLATRLKGARRWWYGGRLGRSALELLGEMTGQPIFEDQVEKVPEGAPHSRSAYVLLEDNTVFGMAKANEQGNYTCVSIARPPGQRQLVTIGRTTLFCAALFGQRLKSILLKPENPTAIGPECYCATRAAYKWTEKASEHWENGDLSLREEYQGALYKMDEFEDKEADRCPIKDYKTEWDYWNESSRDQGIVTTTEPNGRSRQVLQLWRGEGTLKGYICVGGPRRTAINNLVSAIAKFRGLKNPQHPFSCLILSPPGWGKSFLASCLASHFDMEFLEFSVVQMCDLGDIMDCFATIASAQSRMQKRTLVFIDEINAPIKGGSIIPALLSPLWGGTFVKDRQTFRLRPGVWVFASTSTPADDKASDFLSRLNGPIINLDSPGHWSEAIAAIKALPSDQAMSDDPQKPKIYWKKFWGDTKYMSFMNYETNSKKIDDQKTELAYLMVSLLNKRWGPISKVEESVLKLFHDLLPINGYRSLELFAGYFEGIERSEIRRRNVPQFEKYPELCRHVIIPESWYHPSSGDTVLVDIETRVK